MKAGLIALALFAAVRIHGQNFIDSNVLPADARTGVAQAIASVAKTGEAWVAWVVPGGESRSVCCWSGDSCCSTCSLDGRAGFTSSKRSSSPPVQQLTPSIVIVARIRDSQVERIRMFDTECAVDGHGATVHMLRGVTSEQSIEWLLGQMNRSGSRANEILAAVAMHGHDSVNPRLISLARNDERTEVRRSALFWLGQRAGEKAAGELRRAVDEDPEDEVRQHAVFAISQLPRERSVPMLIELVKTHKSPTIRKKAMFWLAQSEDPRALELIEGILR
jgi:hypothetical protein